MEREIKYTDNGKKVVVIGNLNAQEKIVQEIFIINGQEIPSGENFVVKSLHDAPAISWEEKRTKEIKENYERERKRYDSEIDSLRKKIRSQSLSLTKIIEANGLMLKNISEDSFKTLIDFITKDIKWIVKEDYSLPQIYEYGIIRDGEFDENLKLLTLYGRSDGTLQWKINYYSDGSGGHSNVFLFGDYELAFKKYKELIINANYYTKDTFMKAKELGLILDDAKVSKYKQDALNSTEKKIKERTEEIEKFTKELSELHNL
jgi:hypothetical protein